MILLDIKDIMCDEEAYTRWNNNGGFTREKEVIIMEHYLFENVHLNKLQEGSNTVHIQK
jgi:hypothetical protein